MSKLTGAAETSPSCDEVDELDEAILIKIIELKEQYSKQLNHVECWNKISEEINIDIQQYKQCISLYYKKLKNNPQNDDSKLHQLIKSHENTFQFDFCFWNFGALCRFCCRLKSDEINVREIFNDSSEEILDSSNKLIRKIHYTLYDDTHQKIDYKLSNLMCNDCSQKIEEFYTFKQQCDRNTEILLQVKIELDKTQNKPDCLTATVDNDKCKELLENDNEEDVEEEEISQCSEGSCSTGDEMDDVTEESDDQEDSSEQPSKQKKFKIIDESKRDRSRKSYKGKNSQCQVCGKLVKGIQMHMLTHTGEKRHKCSYCSKSFTQSGQLKRHINSHLNIRNYKCPEPGCDRTFVDPSSVTKHLVVHNKEDRKYQCSLCGARFNRLGALRYHEKTHRQERNHTCDICKKSFLAKYDLTKHFRTHTGEKPYSCKYCDKRFSISKNAKVHLRVHTKEKPYACKFCDLSFAYRSSMKNHLIKIHNHADVSSLPLLQAINIAMRTDSDQNDVEKLQQHLTINSIENLEIDAIELGTDQEIHLPLSS